MALWLRPARTPAIALAAFLASGLAGAEPEESGGAIVDADGDGLIEIDTIEDLNNVRYSLDGASLKRSAEDAGNSRGCPKEVCIGYELTANLDFDGPDGDGTTWAIDASGAPSLDAHDSNNRWFDAEAGGWLPIGDCGDDGVCLERWRDTGEDADNRPFMAVFEGNGHTIANLAVSRDLPAVGLFAIIGPGGQIRNLGLVGNLADYRGSTDKVAVGGLAGLLWGGSIHNSYATGEVHGGDGKYEYVGGLVGRMESGSITDSYTTGAASGGKGEVVGLGRHVGVVGGLVGRLESGAITDSHARGDVTGADGDSCHGGGLVGMQYGGRILSSYATGNAAQGNRGFGNFGGLVGLQSQGEITASHATGDIDGGSHDYGAFGGLVGMQINASITASYATGDVDAGNGCFVCAGGLVGEQLSDGQITASYATGNAKSGDGDYDHAGGLAGWQMGFITACYATGDANGGGGPHDSVGGLVGRKGKNPMTASYATGDATGGDEDNVGSLAGSPPGGKIIEGVYALWGFFASDPFLVVASWGFGAARGSGVPGMDGSWSRPDAIESPADISIGRADVPANVPPVWNSAAHGTLGAWDTGSPTENPALAYADYDASGGIFHCAADADSAPEGAILIPHCTSPATLIPGQRQ